MKITPTSVVHFTPQWFGQLEQSINIAHVASVKVDTDMLFANVCIETTGGHNAIHCRGHRKGDAMEMKQLIERFQTEYYKTARGIDDADADEFARTAPICAIS